MCALTYVLCKYNPATRLKQLLYRVSVLGQLLAKMNLSSMNSTMPISSKPK